ncbi:MAG: M56 family metallopeptidase, partial [Oscillospiraceae bacterium]|nr:M56 family metallopeptidase [Oscillospiraceae bacterium]
MLQLILSSSVLILILLAVRSLLRKKLSLRLRYALWLLVALRLLIPIQFGHSSLSLANFIQREESIQEQTQVHVQVHIPQQIPSSTETQLSPQSSVAPLPTIQEPLTDSQLQPTVPLSANLPTSASPTPTYEPQQQLDSTAVEVSTFDLTTNQILNLIWALGALSMAVWFLTVNLRFSHRAREGATVIPAPDYPLTVLETEAIPSPCLMGLFRPRVYLLPEEEPRRQKHILAHELAHYHHGDNLWAFVRALCLCLHWYNPLVWVAAHLSKEDCELACDEGAIARLGEEERIPYGRTLLHTLAQAGRPKNLLQTATTMAGSKKQIKERLEMIVHKPKKLLLSALVLLLVVSLAVGCTFTGATDPEESTQPTEPTETTEAIIEESTAPTETEAPPTEDPTLPYGDTTVEDAYNQDSIRIPKLLLDNDYGKQINADIQVTFGLSEADPSTAFNTIKYSHYTNLMHTYEEPVEELTVLTLYVEGVTVKGDAVCRWYHVDLSTGREPVGLIDPHLKREVISRQFAQELLALYLREGALSFDSEQYQTYLQNTSAAWEESDYGITEDGTILCFSPYQYLDGSKVEAMTFPQTASEAFGVNGITDPKVIELYTYTGQDGSSCRIPFLLMDGPIAAQVNGKILAEFVADPCNKLSYSWSVHGDILSLVIEGEEIHFDGLRNRAFVLSLSNLSHATKAEVLAQASTPMSTQEYEQLASTLFKSHFFTLFPGLDPTFCYSIIEACGSAENVADSIPYLDEEGQLWAYARIYQVAGSSSTWRLVPMSGQVLNEEYEAYAFAMEKELSRLTDSQYSEYPQVIRSTTSGLLRLTALGEIQTLPIYEDPSLTETADVDGSLLAAAQAEAEQKLLQYLSLLYGEGDYELSYTAPQAFPHYADDQILIEAQRGHLQIRPAKGYTSTPQYAPRFDEMPELYAAMELLGITDPKVIKETRQKVTGNNLVSYECSRITQEEADWVQAGIRGSFRYAEAISDPNTGDFYILAHYEDELLAVSEAYEAAPIAPLSLYQFLREKCDWDISSGASFELFYSNEPYFPYYSPCCRIYVPNE